MRTNMRAGMAIVLALLSTGAGAEWSRVATRDSKTLYVDRSTLLRKGPVTTMWYLQDNSRPISAPGVRPYLSSEDQGEYDCKAKRQRTLFFTNHAGRMGTGEVTFVSAAPGEWTPVLPGSLLEEAWKVACRRSGGGIGSIRPKDSTRPYG